MVAARGDDTPICLIGCGTVFDAIAADRAAYAPANTEWIIREAESVAMLASTALQLLDGLDASNVRVFAAVGHNALNYARLEIVGPAMGVKGYKMAQLIHASAHVAPDVTLGSNVWLGPRALVDCGCEIGSNVLIGARARLDSKVRLGPHGWIGAGASLGHGVEVGKHFIIGDDVHLRAGITLGRHCVVDRPGGWNQSLPDGSLAELEFATPAQMIGPGYSFKRAQQKSTP